MTCDGPAARRLLLCRVGALVCALPLQHVVETMRALPVEALAGVPSFVRGVSIIRGAPVPVVDLAALLGQATNVARERLVTVRVEGRHAAFAVTQVLGARTLDVGAVTSLPPLLHGASAQLVRELGALDGELMLIVEASRSVPSSVWEALRVHGAEA